MITVKAYLYPNTAEVQVFDPAIFTTRNRQVYSRPIKVYQGIDNPVQVIVRNQDQKSVDLTGYTVVATIQDPTNGAYIINYAVTFDDITKGLGSFTIDYNTVTGLENRFYKLTFKTIRIEDSLQRPLYIDDNYGVPLDLEILPAYFSTQSIGGGSGTGGGGGGTGGGGTGGGGGGTGGGGTGGGGTGGGDGGGGTGGGDGGDGYIP